jgi:phage N-6-adenine-methyltransferase
MAKFDANRFASRKQDWTTPDGLFEPLQAEFNFTLDAAASPENARAPLFFTANEDGLEQDWGHHTVWLNPPYGDGVGGLAAWVRKSADAAAKGATVVMLIPARTNTVWFHDYCLALAEVRFIKGRPKFGGAIHGLPQPLCLVIFRPTESVIHDEHGR